MFKIFTVKNFDKELKKLLKKYPSLLTDLKKLIKELEEDPYQGILLGKDCYKIRMAISSKNKGKSGG
ncbi:hypothetical protein [Dyadobacter sp. CY345]|uniref:hypothetical protein n=1 Tax=Dyadobacter sp. CY345 TaxID=2909335 RepID=UPI00286E4322|nr:hypothetical protein [Dyadobacter sp. CY345]